jgi:glycosyltransferase involved in cell wall biosynthesis
MRVVHANFVRPLGHADPERLLEEWPTLLDVAAAVVETGGSVTLIQSFSRDAALNSRGVECRFVSERFLPGRSTGMSPRRVARAAAASQPDVIHVNGLDFPVHTRAMSATGIPVLVQDHASRPGGGLLRRRWGLAAVAGVAFTDAGQAQPFIDDGILRKDVAIFSAPESSTHFTPGDQTDAREATEMHGDPAVLWIGRLDLNKDPLTILDAVELAGRELPDLHLWCCYHEEPLLAQVKTRIAASPFLSARVHLLGRAPHEQIELLCRAADIFMVGSHHEGSGYALIEALACGATPIVTNIAPFRRLCGNVGRLVPVADARAFAAGLTEIARKPRAQLRQRALKHFHANLSFEAVGRQLRDIYSVLATGAS